MAPPMKLPMKDGSTQAPDGVPKIPFFMSLQGRFSPLRTPEGLPPPKRPQWSESLNGEHVLTVPSSFKVMFVMLISNVLESPSEPASSPAHLNVTPWAAGLTWQVPSS